MATITNAKLAIQHDNKRKIAEVEVSCDVIFNPTELCQMKACGGRWFKLSCKLYGSDPGPDQYRYTMSSIYYLPDPTPQAVEHRVFKETLGEGILDEDWVGEDEIYAKLILKNLVAHTEITRKTNTVHHHF